MTEPRSSPFASTAARPRPGPAPDEAETAVGRAQAPGPGPGAVSSDGLGAFWGEASEPHLEPGDRLGRWEVLAELGRGGMATVYRVRDPEHGEVALKVLHRRHQGDTRQVARFEREARLTSTLRHPRIVRAIEHGAVDGRPYLLMPIVPGRSLARLVEDDGALEPPAAARLVRDVARVIDAAHRQRVVHRDLTPGNVVLDPAEGPLVLDLGLAKELAAQPAVTGSGEIVGTPAFMAPEQASGALPVDHRVDVHALGALLYFAASAKLPASGETPGEVVQRLIAREDPPRLRDALPGCPPGLDAVCAKAMATHPRDRYQTAEDLALDLERWLRGEAPGARAPGLLRRAWRRARRHPRTAALLVAVALGAGGAAWGGRAAAHTLALRQRAAQARELVVAAALHEAEGRPELADAELWQAQLVARGAYLARPGDAQLRRTLIDVKRARAALAERSGQWTLAAELEALARRLEEGSEAEVDPGAPPLEGPDAGSLGPAVLSVTGLGPGEVLAFVPWRADPGAAAPPPARAERPVVSLAPGAWVASHVDARGAVRHRFLVVLGPGQAHELPVGDPVQRAAGWVLLPPEHVLEAADRAGR